MIKLQRIQRLICLPHSAGNFPLHHCRGLVMPINCSVQAEKFPLRTYVRITDLRIRRLASIHTGYPNFSICVHPCRTLF